MSIIKISAIVVGRNEGQKLSSCLEALQFCDEIFYADLDSIDDSVSIAKSFGCKIFSFKEFGPSCEYSQAKLIKYVKNDWVMLIDPDEVVSTSLANEIIETLPAISKNPLIGDVYVPWQFYFGKKALKGTVWGYNKNKGVLVHKDKYEILPITHYGRKLKEGFQSHFINRHFNNVLHHYWMDDKDSFLKKHCKYLKDEGQDRYNMGQRISFFGVVYNSIFQFFNCYFLKDGFKDGLVGLYLSCFWSRYSTISNWRLYKIIKLENNETN